MNDSESHFSWTGSELLLKVRLTPRSSSDKVLGLMADRLKISITAPPVDGKANAHLVKFLAKQFGVSKSEVTIVSGQTTHDKILSINSPEILPTVFLVQTES